MEVEDLILKKQQLEEKIIEFINEANLPAFAIKPILIDMLEQTAIQERQQLEKAMQHKKEKENNGEEREHE